MPFLACFIIQTLYNKRNLKLTENLKMKKLMIVTLTSLVMLSGCFNKEIHTFPIKGYSEMTISEKVDAAQMYIYSHPDLPSTTKIQKEDLAKAKADLIINRKVLISQNINSL